MSLITSGLAAQPQQPQPAERGSVLGEAFNNGLRNAGAGLTALGGTAAEAVGAPGVAHGLYDTSAGLRNAVTQPAVSSFRDVHDLDSAARYGTNLIGESIPALGVGLAGAALARNPLLGATAATTPFTAGDLAVRQQADPAIAALPAGQRLGSALVGGGLAAAAANVVPVALGGKLLGHGVGDAALGLGRNVATNVAEGVGGNALAGAAGEKINQTALSALNPNRDTSGDAEAIKEAAVGGAAVGVPFAAAGIAGQAAHGKRVAPRTDGVPVPATAEPAKPTLAERIKGAFQRGGDDEAASAIAGGRDLVDAQKLAAASPEEQARILDTADASRVDKVKEWAAKMYKDANLTPESRAKIDDFLTDPADRAKQAAVAGMEQARTAGEKAATAAKDFYDRMAGKFGGDGEDGAKRSDVNSPKLNAAIADTVSPALAQRFPELVQNENAMKSVTGGLRHVMDAMQKDGKIDGDTAEQLHGWFGDDAPSVMAALHSAVLDKSDTAGTERYYRAVNQMTDQMSNVGALADKVKAALPKELQDSATPGDLRQMVQHLREFTDGEGTSNKPKSQVDFEQRQIENGLRQHFGDKTDGLLKAFQKDAEQRFKSKNEESTAGTVETDPEQGINARTAEDVGADTEPVQYHGGGNDKANPQPIPSPDAHRAEHNNAGQAERLIREQQAANPDRVVDFTHLRDLPEEVRAKHPNAGPDDGFVTVEGTRDETRLTPEEFKSVRVDTSKTSHAQNNPSRIDTGVHGAVVDARALVKHMKGKLDRVESDSFSERHRTARAFMEGIAAVQDHLGKSFEVPDSTVIAPGFTYGEAKSLSMRKPDPAWMKGKTDDEINAELARNDSMRDMNDRELAKATVKTQDILTRREAAFQAKVQEERAAGRRLNKEGYRELRKSMGVDEAKSALVSAEREATSRESAVRKAHELDSEGRTEVGADEQIHRAAEAHSADDLTRRVGLDDNPLRKDNFVTRNSDGSHPASTLGAIDSKINRLENMKTADGKRQNMVAAKVAEKARALYDNLDKMKKMDQALLASIVKDPKVSSISETVNALHTKYAAMLAPKAEAKITSGFAKDARTRQGIAKIAADIKLGSGELSARYERLRAQYDKEGRSLDSFTRKFAANLNVPVKAIEGLNALYRAQEGVAKKPSAFVERVLGKGDLAPIKDAIKKSTAPKDVQRVVDALVDHLDNPRAREVLDEANKRLTKMIEKDPDVTYSMQQRGPLLHGTTDEFIQHALRGGEVGPEMALALRDTYAPDMKLKVTESDHIPGDGMLQPRRDGSYEIFIKPTEDRLQYASTLAHEFGHALQFHLFDKAAPEVQAKVRGEYDKLIERYRDSDAPVSEFLHDFLGPHHVKDDGMQAAIKNGMTAREFIKIANEQGEQVGVKNYATLFEEYFANQFSKYITSAESAPPATRSFWAHVATTLKDFYNRVITQMQPGVEFKAWVDSLVANKPEMKFSKQHVAYSMQMKDTEAAEAQRNLYTAPAKMVNQLRDTYAPHMRVSVVERRGVASSHVTSNRDGSFTIVIDAARNHIDKASTVAHEFGHALQRHLFDIAPEGVRAKIKGEYDALIEKYAGAAADRLTGEDFVKDFLTFTSLSDVEKGMSARQFIDDLNARAKEAGAGDNYATDFDEYFANQFARHTATDKANTPPAVRSFWEKAMGVIRDFYDNVIAKMKPGVEFKSWVESLAAPERAFDNDTRAFFHELRSGDVDVKGMIAEFQNSHDFAEMRDLRDQLSTLRYPNKPITDMIAGLDTRLKSDTQFSKQRVDPNVTNTSGKLADVQAHIEKVLGKTVDVEFKKMLHAGEFVRDAKRAAAGMNEDAIRISAYSLDPMSTAYHESLHAFFAKLRDAGLMQDAHPLLKAADSSFVTAKLRELLKGEPEALRQIGQSLEERAAYMYQFWAAGKLTLPTKPAGILGHIADFFKRVLGIWTNDQRATHIMEYFNSGEYAKNMGDRNAVARTLAKGTNSSIETFKGMIEPLTRLSDAVVATGNGRLRAAMIPALTELADRVYSPLQGEHADPGYVPAARAKRGQLLNDLAERLHGHDPAAITDALESMQKGVAGASPAERIVMREVRKMLRETHDYMLAAGVKVGDLGEDYFPRVWEPNTILANEQAFRDMLQPYKDRGEFVGSIDKVMATLTRADGSDLQVETIKPGMQYAKERVLGFVSGLDAEPFLRKNLYDTLNSYVTQATRRAEWSRRFKDDGSGLQELLKRAKDEGATDAHMKLANDYLQGVDGTLGDKINPNLRRAYGNMIVYQNVRILPLAIFSSLIDPMGVLVRGGTVGDAFRTMKRGFAEIPKGFNKNAQHDEATKIATQLGVIDSAVLMHTIGSSFSQGMTSDLGRKINTVFFKYNLMEQFNTSMRVGATEAALGFLARHADGSNSQHSTRWLGELGLKPGEVVVNNGRPLLSAAEFEAHGMAPDRAQAMADKMTLAVNKWVDGAILRPNAAHKPIWMNDPHFALVAHLKQFVYSFQETILKRVANEVRHGNVGPAYALAAYVPFMLAADLAKGVIVGGGSQPSSRDSWDAADYAFYEVQRAGLFGVGQFGVDALKGLHRGGLGVIGALSGPTIEQLGEVAKTVAGPEQFKTFAMNALPANTLFSAAESATTNAVD